MKIRLNAKSYFEKYVPGRLSEGEIPAPKGATIGDLLNGLEISPQTPVLLLVNGIAKARSHILKDSDELTLLPLMDGG